MELIRLNTVQGGEVWLNPSAIVTIVPRSESAAITLSNGAQYTVTETLEQIVALEKKLHEPEAVNNYTFHAADIEGAFRKFKEEQQQHRRRPYGPGYGR